MVSVLPVVMPPAGSVMVTTCDAATLTFSRESVSFIPVGEPANASEIFKPTTEARITNKVMILATNSLCCCRKFISGF